MSRLICSGAGVRPMRQTLVPWLRARASASDAAKAESPAMAKSKFSSFKRPASAGSRRIPTATPSSSCPNPTRPRFKFRRIRVLGAPANAPTGRTRTKTHAGMDTCHRADRDCLRLPVLCGPRRSGQRGIGRSRKSPSAHITRVCSPKSSAKRPTGSCPPRMLWRRGPNWRAMSCASNRTRAARRHARGFSAAAGGAGRRRRRGHQHRHLCR